MQNIDELKFHTVDANALSKYLVDNYQIVYDFFNHSRYEELISVRGDIDKYLAFYVPVFRKLDLTVPLHVDFITLLLDVSERLRFRNHFSRIHDHLKENDIGLSNRLRAGALYLIGINYFIDYEKRYDEICRLLDIAYETEEDNADHVLATFINFYAEIVNNFADINLKAVGAFKERIVADKNSRKYRILQHDLILEVLKLDVISYDQAFRSMQTLLDRFLGREELRIFLREECLVESGTSYAKSLQALAADFLKIKALSKSLYKQDDEIFYSLGRGTSILDSEQQLYGYLYSFGDMHYHKIWSAYEFLPEKLLRKDIQIIDWACGQGLATMVYLDFLRHKAISRQIRHIKLIEPSVMALKRAALHVKKYDETFNIKTLNKELDALVIGDLRSVRSLTKMHFFSNVLDMDNFSLMRLMKLLEEGYPGENYFVCASPNATTLKTSRLKSFIHYFSGKPGFEILGEANDDKGEWNGNWTRIVRVFKVNL